MREKGRIPSLSNESSAFEDEPRFHLKLRNGLLDRDLRLIFVPDVGDGNVADKRFMSATAIIMFRAVMIVYFFCCFLYQIFLLNYNFNKN